MKQYCQTNSKPSEENTLCQQNTDRLMDNGVVIIKNKRLNRYRWYTNANIVSSTRKYIHLELLVFDFR